MNKNYVFKRMSLLTGKQFGELTFQQESEEQAVKSALSTAKLKNQNACLGPTGRVIYPNGPNNSDNEVWVLPAQQFSVLSNK